MECVALCVWLHFKGERKTGQPEGRKRGREGLAQDLAGSVTLLCRKQSSFVVTTEGSFPSLYTRRSRPLPWPHTRQTHTQSSYLKERTVFGPLGILHPTLAQRRSSLGTRTPRTPWSAPGESFLHNSWLPSLNRRWLTLITLEICGCAVTNVGDRHDFQEQKGCGQGKRWRKTRERQIGRFVKSSNGLTTTDSCKGKASFPSRPVCPLFPPPFLHVLIQDWKVFTK